MQRWRRSRQAFHALHHGTQIAITVALAAKTRGGHTTAAVHQLDDIAFAQSPASNGVTRLVAIQPGGFTGNR